ncbi:unnamed protein product, partial [Porites lobata]
SLANSSGAKTFGEWSDRFLRHVTSHFSDSSTRVDYYTPETQQQEATSNFAKRYGCLQVHQDQGVYIPVHRIPLSEEKRKSLLAFHAITGCDTTSQYYSVGKA